MTQYKILSMVFVLPFAWVVLQNHQQGDRLTTCMNGISYSMTVPVYNELYAAMNRQDKNGFEASLRSALNNGTLAFNHRSYAANCTN